MSVKLGIVLLKYIIKYINFIFRIKIILNFYIISRLRKVLIEFTWINDVNFRNITYTIILKNFIITRTMNRDIKTYECKDYYWVSI